MYRFFSGHMRCSPDVSSLLCDLCCYNGAIPTGSSVSQLLAFFASLPLFEEIDTLAKDSDLVFTVYVDDLTFSGSNIPESFTWEIKKLIHAFGYSYHKEHSSPPNKNKLVTGLIINDCSLKVRNRHLKSLHNLYVQHLEGSIQNDDYPRLIGRLSSASQVNKDYLTKLKHIIKVRRIY